MKPHLFVQDATNHYRVASEEEVLYQAKTILRRKFRRGTALSTPQDSAEAFKAQFAGLEHEVFACLFLDSRHKVLEYVELFRGTIDGAFVHPREVVKQALHHNATAVILAHNHPSGEAEPSRADVTLTKRLTDALALVDVWVLDHIVTGGTEHVSFAERGLI